MTLLLGILAAWILLDLLLVAVWVVSRWALARRDRRRHADKRQASLSAPASRRESAWDFPKVPKGLR